MEDGGWLVMMLALVGGLGSIDWAREVGGREGGESKT